MDAVDAVDLLMDALEIVVPVVFDLLCSNDLDQEYSMSLNCAAFDDC